MSIKCITILVGVLAMVEFSPCEDAPGAVHEISLNTEKAQLIGGWVVFSHVDGKLAPLGVVEFFENGKAKRTTAKDGGAVERSGTWDWDKGIVALRWANEGDSVAVTEQLFGVFAFGRSLGIEKIPFPGKHILLSIESYFLVLGKGYEPLPGEPREFFLVRERKERKEGQEASEEDREAIQ